MQNEEENIKLDVQLNEQDYINFLIDHGKAHGKFKRLMYFGIYSIVIAGLALYSNYVSNQTSYFSFLPLLIFLLVFAGLMYELRVKSRVIFSNEPKLNQPYEVVFNEVGIEVNRRENSWNLNWREVYDFLITQKEIVVYVSPVKAVIIPERFLTTGLQIKSISNLLSEKIKLQNREVRGKGRNYTRIFIFAFIILYLLITWLRSLNYV